MNITRRSLGADGKRIVFLLSWMGKKVSCRIFSQDGNCPDDMFTSPFLSFSFVQLQLALEAERQPCGYMNP